MESSEKVHDTYIAIHLHMFIYIYIYVIDQRYFSTRSFNSQPRVAEALAPPPGASKAPRAKSFIQDIVRSLDPETLRGFEMGGEQMTVGGLSLNSTGEKFSKESFW